MDYVLLAEMMIIARVGPNGRARICSKADDIRVVRFAYDPTIPLDALTFGACEAKWTSCPENRMLYVYELLWRLQVEFGFPAGQLHDAMKVVPEYNDLIGHEQMNA